LKILLDSYTIFDFFFNIGSNIDTVIKASPPNMAPLYPLQSQNNILAQSENVARSKQSYRKFKLTIIIFSVS
jgi:hypothetical protein